MTKINTALTIVLDSAGCVPIVGSVVGLCETLTAMILLIQECVRMHLLKKEKLQLLKDVRVFHKDYRKVLEEILDFTEQVDEGQAFFEEEQYVLKKRAERLQNRRQTKDTGSNSDSEDFEREMNILIAEAKLLRKRYKQFKYEELRNIAIWLEVFENYQQEEKFLEDKEKLIAKRLRNHQIEILKLGEHIIAGLLRVTFIGGIEVALLDLGSFLYECCQKKLHTRSQKQKLASAKVENVKWKKGVVGQNLSQKSGVLSVQRVKKFMPMQ